MARWATPGSVMAYARFGKAMPKTAGVICRSAAALEPNRSIFHSYLGKAFSNVGNETQGAPGTGSRQSTRSRSIRLRGFIPRSKTGRIAGSTKPSATSRNQSSSTTTGGFIARSFCSIRIARCGAPTWRRFIRKMGWMT